jgi:poly(beta-D-mannuronate) C5 epimerase
VPRFTASFCTLLAGLLLSAPALTQTLYRDQIEALPSQPQQQALLAGLLPSAPALTQTLYRHQIEALPSQPQQQARVELLANTTASVAAGQLTAVAPRGQARVSLAPMFSAQLGSWPFESLVNSGLFKTIADYQNEHPRILQLDAGSIDLAQLTRAVANPKILARHKDGYLLSYPLLIGAEAALLVEDSRLYLNSRSGAALINLGQLRLQRSHLQSWSGEIAPAHPPLFRPFVMAWAGSLTLIEHSTLSRLGYNAHLTRGLSSRRSPQQNSRVGPARILIRDSQLREMASGAELHDALVLIDNSSFADIQQYAIDLHNSRLSLRQNRIRQVRNQSAIRISGASSGDVTQNLIIASGKSAIEVLAQSGDLSLLDNLIGNSGSSGIRLQDRPPQAGGRLLVAGNLIANSHGSGIDAENIGAALIAGNRINASPEYAISLRSSRPQPGRIGLFDNRLANIGKSMIRSQGIANLQLGGNRFEGLTVNQVVLAGDLLPVQSLLLETTVQLGCIAQLQIATTAQAIAPMPKAPRCD